ncbi:hypothetical protein [Corynebacterium durum]|uniref:hypothetical protein n=1 Tax=Corynebacterium durum TaxID=61592 RepID=UPI0028E7B618|nr:hypothetical protein [Corynebacterium durum]
MRGCTRALMMALVALIVAATAPLATAQDDRSNWDAAYDECIQRAADEYADKKAATLGDQALMYDEPLQRWLQQRIAGTNGEEVEKRKQERRNTDEWKAAREGFLNKKEGDFEQLAQKFNCVLNQPVEAAVRQVNEWWESPFGKFVTMIKDGNPEIIAWTMTVWTKFGVDTDALTTNATGINNIIWSLTAFGFALSLVWGTIRVLLAKEEGSSEALTAAAKGYGEYLIKGVLTPLLAVPTLIAFDTWADSIINTYVTTNGDFSKLVEGAKLGQDLNPILVFILVGLSALGSAAFAFFLAIRPVVLALILGLLPAIAAWQIGRSGRHMIDNLLGILTSFILLKFFASLFYSVSIWVGFNLDGSDQNKLITVIILGCAAVSAPATYKLFMSAFGGAAGPSTGSIASAMMMATGAVATGGALVGGAVGAAASGAGSVVSGAASAAGQMKSGATGAAGNPGGSPAAAPRMQRASTGTDSGPSTGAVSTGRGASRSSTGPATGSGGGDGGSRMANVGRRVSAGMKRGGAALAAGSRTAARHTGAGLKGGGAALAAGSRIAARLANNAGNYSVQASRITQGLFDESVGSPTHPGHIGR